MFCAGSGDRQVVSNPAHLRPGKEWIGGAWRDRPGEPIPVRYLRAAQAKAAAAAAQQPELEPEPVPAPALEPKLTAKQRGRPARAPRLQLKENSGERANGAGGGSDDGEDGGSEEGGSGNGGGPVLVRRSQRDRRERVIMVRGGKRARGSRQGGAGNAGGSRGAGS